jgi:hypothetical protein
MPQPHISEDQLDRYAVGALPPETLADVEEHLLICEPCRSELRQSDEFAALFRQAATLPEARSTRRWLPSWGWKVTAGSGVAVALAVLLVVNLRPGAAPDPIVVSLQSMRGPEAPARIQAGRPAVLVFDLDPQAGAQLEARVVHRDGTEKLRPRAESRDGRLSVAIGRLSQGLYWVRVFREGASDPIAEYGLEAQ